VCNCVRADMYIYVCAYILVTYVCVRVCNCVRADMCIYACAYAWMYLC